MFFDVIDKSTGRIVSRGFKNKEEAKIVRNELEWKGAQPEKAPKNHTWSYRYAVVRSEHHWRGPSKLVHHTIGRKHKD